MFMKKYYKGFFLLIYLMFLGGCADNKEGIADQTDEKVVDVTTMNSTVKVDPSINLSSTQSISIIIEFKTKPAKIAMLEAKAKGLSMTLDEAKRHVEESHQAFQEELHTFLDKNRVKYRINYRYKTTFNGVAMEMPANEIKRLMGSSVISRIYPNHEIQLDPPIQPSNQK